jgi:hypothetical protein
MKKKTLSKKLVFNKITIAQLNHGDLRQLHGGVRIEPLPLTQTCYCTEVYTVTCYCTVGDTCNNSIYGNTTCNFTNYGDMHGCPATMTFCGQWVCP